MPRTVTAICRIFLLGFFAAIFPAVPAHAKILWSDPGARVVHETGEGVDILGGKVKRDDKASDALYFKFHVDPISDLKAEPYFAGIQLFEGNHERLGVGNALEAWGYSALNTSQTGSSNDMLPGNSTSTPRIPNRSGSASSGLTNSSARASNTPSSSKFNTFPATTTG